jgi:hypothetical protein
MLQASRSPDALSQTLNARSMSRAEEHEVPPVQQHGQSDGMESHKAI